MKTVSCLDSWNASVCRGLHGVRLLCGISASKLISLEISCPELSHTLLRVVFEYLLHPHCAVERVTESGRRAKSVTIPTPGVKLTLSATMRMTPDHDTAAKVQIYFTNDPLVFHSHSHTLFDMSTWRGRPLSGESDSVAVIQRREQMCKQMRRLRQYQQ